jgi:hypothetical protein
MLSQLRRSCVNGGHIEDRCHRFPDLRLVPARDVGHHVTDMRVRRESATRVQG